MAPPTRIAPRPSASGAAKAAIAPRLRARLDISGSGEVALKTRPATLEKNVSGSGEVKELES